MFVFVFNLNMVVANMIQHWNLLFLLLIWESSGLIPLNRLLWSGLWRVFVEPCGLTILPSRHLFFRAAFYFLPPFPCVSLPCCEFEQIRRASAVSGLFKLPSAEHRGRPLYSAVSPRFISSSLTTPIFLLSALSSRCPCAASSGPSITADESSAAPA